MLHKRSLFRPFNTALEHLIAGNISKLNRYGTKSKENKCNEHESEKNEEKYEKENEKESHEKPKVVIVGAGMAGLSAAEQLIRSGIEDVTILEALDRLGGRICSCSVNCKVIELGAQWITGCTTSNPVMSLARDLGLLDSKTDLFYNYDYTSGVYMTSAGRPIDPAVGFNAYSSFNLIKDQAYGLHNINSPLCQGRLIKFFSYRIRQELHKFPKNQREDAARILYGLTNKLGNRWGTDIHNMSSDILGTFTRLSGGTIGLYEGLITLLSPLLKVIPEDKIKYSRHVHHINWDNVNNNEARVTVSSCDGIVEKADYVIVTVSLGALKQNAKALFEPSLPDEKLDAINGLGFGNIAKLFFQYERPFWIAQERPIKFAWSLKEIKNKDSWTKSLSSLEGIPGHNNILMATIFGEHADEVENESDVAVAESITKLLKQFCQDPSIPFPDNMIKSNWRSNEFFCGSNCYLSCDTTVDHIQNLMSPLPNDEGDDDCEGSLSVPVVFFAGEATCPQFFSTIHGARASGVRAAQSIINLTKKFNGAPPKKTEN